MIQAIVFSCDRAAQLDLLLRSIEKNAPGVFDPTITYNASNNDFLAGYDALRSERPGRWVYQWEYGTDVFKWWLLDLIGGHQFTCFFCDDDVIYRLVTPAIEEQITPETACFSLRLGHNTTYSYMTKRPNTLREFEDNVLGFISWDWTDHEVEPEFGYPLSLNGHVFRTDMIKWFIRATGFQTVNQLEARMQRLRRKLPPRMAAYGKSRLVNVPVNRVQTDFPNRHGEQRPRSTEGLNARFMFGERIDLDAMDFRGVRGCYEELELPMREFS